MKYTGPAKRIPTRTLAHLLNYREAFVLTLVYLVCLIVLALDMFLWRPN